MVTQHNLYSKLLSKYIYVSLDLNVVHLWHYGFSILTLMQLLIQVVLNYYC